jgi:hypothetical protein
MTAEILVNGSSRGSLVAKCPSENGLSYLHIQTLSECADTEGTLIKRLEKKKLG